MTEEKKPGFTCNRCGHVIPETGDRWDDGGALIEHMESAHAPHPVSPFRENPPMPSDPQLWEWFFVAAGGGDTGSKEATEGLRAVWRAGCDAGMEAFHRRTTISDLVRDAIDKRPPESVCVCGDPKPYVRDDGWRRAPSTAVYLDGIGYSFAPRPEYSQNKEDYA